MLTNETLFWLLLNVAVRNILIKDCSFSEEEGQTSNPRSSENRGGQRGKEWLRGGEGGPVKLQPFKIYCEWLQVTADQSLVNRRWLKIWINPERGRINPVRTDTLGVNCPDISESRNKKSKFREKGDFRGPRKYTYIRKCWIAGCDMGLKEERFWKQESRVAMCVRGSVGWP